MNVAAACLHRRAVLAAFVLFGVLAGCRRAPLSKPGPDGGAALDGAAASNEAGSDAPVDEAARADAASDVRDGGGDRCDACDAADVAPEVTPPDAAPAAGPAATVDGGPCAPGLALCGEDCVDLKADPLHCGRCDGECPQQENVVPSCVAGLCSTATCQFGFGTCPASSAPACATPLDTTANCGACGIPACGVAHTLLTCSAAGACGHPVCAAGFANCNATSPDCETAFDAAGGCFPTYSGTLALADLSVVASAVAADGSLFLAGTFTAPTDFDPGSAKDTRAPIGPSDVFLTKLTASGAAVWTLTFGGAASSTGVSAVFVSASAIVLVGQYTADVDFDPGPGSAVRSVTHDNSTATWVSRFTLDGKLTWVSTFTGNDLCLGRNVTTDAAGAVYVTGQQTSTCDFDPGPGLDEVQATGLNGAGFIVKLGAADGAEVWSRAVTGETCANYLEGAVMATDGNIWIGGQASGRCAFGTVVVDGSSTTTGLVGAFTPEGAVHFAGTLGSSADTIAAAPDGSIFVGGRADGVVDLDPGAATVTRALPGNDGNNGGFVVKLGADGSFRWAATLHLVPVVSLAATADSSVIAAGATFLDAQVTGLLFTRIGGDGTAAWSMGVPSPDIGIGAVAAGASGFVVVGATDANPVDVVPGAGVFVVPAGAAFVSRYSF
jgi:hypothetical protein